MERDEAKVYVTKIASAQRQLDSAIRMFLSDEDELAVHTLGAAAFRVLRDIKQKRGHGQLADEMSLGLFAFADDLVSGRLQELPDFVVRDGLQPKIEEIAEGMRQGKIVTYDDIRLAPNLASEKRHWAEFNKTANFLKHSDLDEEKLLLETNLRNDLLLAQACVAYKQLVNNWTPEMFVLGQLQYVESDYQPFELIGIAAELYAVAPQERKRQCLKIIDRLKKAEVSSS